MKAQVDNTLTLPTLTDLFTVNTKAVVKVQRDIMDTMAGGSYNDAVLQLIRTVQEQEQAFSTACDAFENKQTDAHTLLEAVNGQFAIIAGGRGFLLQLVDITIKGEMREKLRSTYLRTEVMVEEKMETMLERLKELVKDEPSTLVWYELTGFTLIPSSVS